MNIIFREASRNDLPNLTRLLADDPLGAERENYTDPLPETYYEVFDQEECSLIISMKS